MLGSLNKKDSMGERGGTNRPVQSLKKARQEMMVLTVCAGSGCGQMWQAAGVQSRSEHHGARADLQVWASSGSCLDELPAID